MDESTIWRGLGVTTHGMDALFGKFTADLSCTDPMERRFHIRSIATPHNATPPAALSIPMPKSHVRRVRAVMEASEMAICRKIMAISMSLWGRLRRADSVLACSDCFSSASAARWMLPFWALYLAILLSKWPALAGAPQRSLHGDRFREIPRFVDICAKYPRHVVGK